MTRIELTFDAPVPLEIARDIEDKLLYCSPDIDGWELAADGRSAVLRVNRHQEAADLGAVARRLVTSMVRGYRPTAREEIFRHDVSPPHREPVWDALVDRNQVVELGPGQVALLGDCARVHEALDRRLLSLIADRFGAQPHQYPSLLPVAILDRFQYLASFPQHVTFAPHLREDLDVLNEFSEESAHDQATSILPRLAPPAHALAPTPCFHTYAVFADRELPAPTTVTARARCFRYESRRLQRLERSWDFTIRELVFLGSRGFVDECRASAIRMAEELVTRLGLCAFIETASDPFFASSFGAKRFHQRLTRAKYELRLTLPATETFLAAASFNVHGDFFGRHFDISFEGQTACSGCVGFGLERWTWALFCQFGPELARWPTSARAELSL